MSARYALELPDGARRRLAVGWLALALASLVASGVFSVLLVLSRAPYTKDVFPLVDFFHVALVVHVDLSVLVWFAAFAGVFWSLNSTPRLADAGWVALGLATGGTAVMSAAPFAGRGSPIMANYIPVLDDPVFLGGLAIFAAGFVVLVVRSMAAVPPVGTRLDGPAALRFGLNAAVVSAAVALIAFAWSWLEVPAQLEGKAYYELLFWGGGHVLQFTWTLLMFVAWLWLAEACGAPAPRERPLHAALVASLVLFGVGGVIGAMIHGSNVKIPAHYHGSIVGITLAFMGLTYHLLPGLGFGAPALRAASWQPWIYGGGQLAHVIGLVWSGGYGVQRKVAGAAQALRTPEEVAAMGLMGLGGLVAVAGGLMFLVIVLRAMARTS